MVENGIESVQDSISNRIGRTQFRPAIENEKIFEKYPIQYNKRRLLKRKKMHIIQYSISRSRTKQNRCFILYYKRQKHEATEENSIEPLS